MNNCMVIAITETKMALEGKENISIKERLTIAMKAMLCHWLVTNEEEQFQVAVGAVLLTASEEEKARINHELKIMKALSAAQSGVPVDFSQVLEKDSFEPIGLVGLWKKIKDDE